ncbi:MAG: response regulator [Elusimicrobia bacterium]|nr:response regulator [Elusimicrobiota bacterium]
MSKKILLIDDEMGVTELAGAILKMGGFAVEAANKSVDALKRLETERYDAVIMDLMMPTVEGMGLVEKIRGLPSCAQTFLFVMSAKKLSAEERKFLVDSRIHFIPKPFSPAQLVSQLSEKLSK